jgi:SAM-dependent methyltransferase
MDNQKKNPCWVCASECLFQVKPSEIKDALSSADFAITDKNYGVTAAIYQCQNCSFLQCSDITDVLQFYNAMDDESYEATRDQRALQAKKLIVDIRNFVPAGNLLDIGAGSGIMVEQADILGYQSTGIEPSVGLCNRAVAHGLNVINGVLPNSAVTQKFDVVTLIDIIEHVTDPYELVLEASKVMDDDAVMVIVTPDVSSIAARVMGWNWWHYRIAHVGYFNESNLRLLLGRAGLEVVSVSRPSWYFPLGYLLERVLTYFPSWLRFPVPSFLQRITLPLNLFDSLRLVCRKKS